MLLKLFVIDAKFDTNENKTDEDSKNNINTYTNKSTENSTIDDQALMKRKSKKFDTIGELMDDMYFEIHNIIRIQISLFFDHNTLLKFAGIYQSNELSPREILNGFIKKIHVSGDIHGCNAPNLLWQHGKWKAPVINQYIITTVLLLQVDTVM